MRSAAGIEALSLYNSRSVSTLHKLRKSELLFCPAVSSLPSSSLIGLSLTINIVYNVAFLDLIHDLIINPES